LPISISTIAVLFLWLVTNFCGLEVSTGPCFSTQLAATQLMNIMASGASRIYLFRFLLLVTPLWLDTHASHLDNPKVIPLTCHGHSRPITHLNFSSVVENDQYYLISASKGKDQFVIRRDMLICTRQQSYAP
jgi:hypothetical protein